MLQVVVSHRETWIETMSVAFVKLICWSSLTERRGLKLVYFSETKKLIKSSLTERRGLKPMENCL